MGETQVGPMLWPVAVSSVLDASGESPRAFPKTCVTASTDDARAVLYYSSLSQMLPVKVLDVPHLNLAL